MTVTGSKLSRRTLVRSSLFASGVLAASALLAACGTGPGESTAAPTSAAASSGAAPTAPTAQPTTAPPPTTAANPITISQATPAAAPTTVAAAVPTKFNEAPALADQVKAGKLPPVEQRLPQDPLVITPQEQVGVYGGAWHSGEMGKADSAWMTRTLGYEGLVRWDLQWQKIIPNLASRWEVSSDGSEFTWYLRKGVKWSNGDPLTTDDIVFWYEDIILNPELTNSENPPPSWFTIDGKPGKITKVDDYTFTMAFVKPNGLLLQNLATPNGIGWIVPSKYAKQFHKKYNPNIDQLVKQNNASDWVALFQAKVWNNPNQVNGRWFNPELPTYFAWALQQGIDQSLQQLTAVRNPYYWKVDPTGNQLPYLDQLVYYYYQKPEELVLKALNGEIDMMDRSIATNQNKAVFTQNQQKGNYGFFSTISSSTNVMAIAFNLNHPDPVLKKIFQTKDFRAAMSQAINRAEIIDLIYLKQGQPRQLAPLDQAGYNVEKLATQYLTYDPKAANDLLDKIGLNKKDANGIRLRPDGKPLSINMEVTTGSTEWIDALQLIQKYWKAVGVDMQVKTEDRSLFYTRKDAWQHDANVWGGDGGMEGPLEMRWFFPFSHESNFATAWYWWWVTGGKKGEKPSDAAAQQQALYDQIKVTADPAQQKKLMQQILDI